MPDDLSRSTITSSFAREDHELRALSRLSRHDAPAALPLLEFWPTGNETPRLFADPTAPVVEPAPIEPNVATPIVTTSSPTRPKLRVGFGRMARLGVAVLMLATGIVFLVQRFVLLRSDVAVLGAAPITLRAPIDGVLTLEGPRLGDIVAPRALIATVRDDTVDRSRDAELAMAVRVAEEDLAALHIRLGQTAVQARESQAHAADFGVARREQLAARLREAQASLTAAEARAKEAGQTLARTETLARTRTASLASLDQARAAAAAAQGELEAARHRLAAAKAEQAAAGAGVFALDAATDRSVSQQRADALRTRAGDLASEVASAEARVAGLRAQLEAERASLSQRTRAEVALPARARLISLAARDGELVRRGQPIGTAVDCAQPLVTAEVSEPVFRALSLGRSGRFTLADGRRLGGQIVRMIAPVGEPGSDGEAVSRGDRYVVVLRLDPIDAAPCDVGRMGSVDF